MTGWNDCPIQIATWRAPPFDSGRFRLYEMALWGESIPTTTLSIERIGPVVSTHVLKQGFTVRTGHDAVTIRRPRFGLLPSFRAIHFDGPGLQLVLRSAQMYGTELRRNTGRPVALFTFLGTWIDPFASGTEAAMVLTVICQHLMLRVGPLAFTAGINLPRFDGTLWTAGYTETPSNR